MKLDLIVETAMTEFKTKLTQLCSELPKEALTPEMAEMVLGNSATVTC